uniref:Peroxisomal membrane protein PEX14 n=1 Tax=Polytomella parva TaxID=51329 RepID=A0A7S0V2V5_9CHLO|eukprot:CAMPEP_0175067946 /NCGR_PEP_ID=MMETSP0052_2-20121109/17394_1 /TAXON_ID=51329 ORGANISM="Polytomella parva, Strain SAG 63-3" /NCGR_SAMPLE_ID=MMETSP0052_2 /ASSEMBLY_ACC=CAM_ASM_000194 /LENGTH=560 /DNA_ID=CAMNT_0016334911 /DNA_START=28 /DNA_END=1710 /DNA_ORIENTATION=-
MAAPAPSTEVPAGETAGTEAPTTTTSPSIREDQVKNAVAFLSHPKVKSSSIEAKRSFLERKGLTTAEIEAAFQQVPQDAPESKAVAATVAPTTSVASKSSSGQTPPKPWQQTQAQGQQQPYYGQQMVPYQPVAVARPPLRWSQIVLRLGFIGVSAYSLHRFLYPYVLKIITNYRAAQQKKEDEKTQLLTELISAVRSLKESQMELKSTGESLSAAVTEMNEFRREDEDRRRQEEDRRILESIQALPPSRPGAPSVYSNGNYSMSYTVKEPQGVISNSNAFRNNSPTYYTSSHGEIVPSSTAATSVIAKESSSSSNSNSNSAANGSSGSNGYSSSYMEIMEMVKNNITPPNVRTDIKDTPPNPNQPISQSKIAPQPKPWEVMAATRASLGSVVDSSSSFPSSSAAVSSYDEVDLTPSFLAGTSSANPVTADQLPLPVPTPAPAPVSILSSIPSADSWKPPVIPQRRVKVGPTPTTTLGSGGGAAAAAVSAVSVSASSGTSAAVEEDTKAVEVEVPVSKVVNEPFAALTSTISAPMAALSAVEGATPDLPEGEVVTQVLEDE